MRHSKRLLCLALILGLVGSLGLAPSPTAARRAQAADNTLTIMTCCGMWAGFTKAAIAGSGIPYLGYYKNLWKKRFPGLKIVELDVPDAEMQTKIILGVNAGNPPDLVGVDTSVGILAARHALTNLDPYYKLYNITPSYFLPAMADWARIKNSWYAMPAASGPSSSEILYIPKFVKAAGWDPTKIPTTWSGLWTATQKVTKWDSKGNLERIGVQVSGASSNAINLYCGSFATYEPKTSKFHANSPCIKDYFHYQKRLLDFYGGVQKYTKFISGDPGVWGGYTPKAYLPTGKLIFDIDAYWTGQQMDNFWNLDWRLSPPPTPHGTLDERRANTITQWMVAIPTGAKHARLAFDFAKYTLWDYGYVQGPTTNGYTVAKQADQWAQEVVRAAGQIRASHHFPGNPMSGAVKLVMQDAQLAQAFGPTDVAASYYSQQLSRAWDQIRFGRATVEQAVDETQRLVDSKQRVLHAQFGM